MAQPLAPINDSKRLPVIDALRGLAILGILFINVKGSSFPVDFGELYELRLDGIVDKIIYWGTEFLVQGKFFTMFTFLFGLGMAVQMSRAIAKGGEEKFPAVYVRRLTLLFIIGFIHDVFIWRGYILLWYPVIGFLLLLIRNFKPKLMVSLAIIFIMLLGGVSVLRYTLRPTPPPQKEQHQAAEKQKPAKTAEQLAWEKCNAVIQIFKEGGYGGMVNNRLGKILPTLKYNLYYGLHILGMFMLGIWAWRKGLFHDTGTHLKLIKKIFVYSLLTGVIFTAITIQYRIWGGAAGSPIWMYAWFSTLTWTGMAAFTVCYVSGFLLLFRKAFFRRLVKPLESVGRAALSNYIFQNIVMGFIFYSYGFKIMGTTGPLVNLLICFLIFAIQIPLSMWWMNRFRFGPAEWLWRTLTYGKRQPMKKREPGSFQK